MSIDKTCANINANISPSGSIINKKIIARKGSYWNVIIVPRFLYVNRPDKAVVYESYKWCRVWQIWYVEVCQLSFACPEHENAFGFQKHSTCDVTSHIKTFEASVLIDDE